MDKWFITVLMSFVLCISCTKNKSSDQNNMNKTEIIADTLKENGFPQINEGKQSAIKTIFLTNCDSIYSMYYDDMVVLRDLAWDAYRNNKKDSVKIYLEMIDEEYEYVSNAFHDLLVEPAYYELENQGVKKREFFEEGEPPLIMKMYLAQ